MYDCNKCGSRKLKRISGGIRCGQCGAMVTDKKKALAVMSDRIGVVQREKAGTDEGYDEFLNLMNYEFHMVECEEIFGR